MAIMSDLKSPRLWLSMFGEFLSTLMFVFIVTGTVLNAQQNWGDGSVVHISLTVGLAITTLAISVGHVSGGAINPAVSITLVVARKLDVLEGVLQVIGQIIGGITGAAILYGLTPEEKRGMLGVTSLAPGVSRGQGFGIELMLTFLLLFTIFSVTDKGRGMTGYQPPLAIGFSILVAHLVGVQYTGCGINPARSFGPAVVMNEWKDHWIYWVGPILGGILGGLIYELMFSTEEGKTLLKRPEQGGNSNPNVFETQEMKNHSSQGRV